MCNYKVIMLQIQMKVKSQMPGQILYKLDNASKQEMLEESGYLLLRIVDRYSEVDSDKYHLVSRILSKQYHVKGKKIRLKEVKQIRADSLQSPHDEDGRLPRKIFWKHMFFKNVVYLAVRIKLVLYAFCKWGKI